MFTETRTDPSLVRGGNIPGYTGYDPTDKGPRVVPRAIVQEPCKKNQRQIPNCGIYVKGIKSENLFGKGHGTITTDVDTGNYEAGLDHSKHLRYQTTSMATFNDPSKREQPSASKFLGLNKQPDRYKKPITAQERNTFWGVDSDQLAPEAKDSGLKEATQKFFRGMDNTVPTQKKKQNEDAAINAYFGVEDDPDMAQKLDAAVCGYGGTNERVVADNVFAKTHKDSQFAAFDSKSVIKNSEGSAIKTQSLFLPEYKR